MSTGDEDRYAALLVERLRAGLQGRPPLAEQPESPQAAGASTRLEKHPGLRRLFHLVAAIPTVSAASSRIRRALSPGNANPDTAQLSAEAVRAQAALARELERHTAELERLQSQIDQLRLRLDAVAGVGPDHPDQR
jgi:hypothetical protein